MQILKITSSKRYVENYAFDKSKYSITIKELADKVNISTLAIDKTISKLKAYKRIERIGRDKGEH